MDWFYLKHSRASKFESAKSAKTIVIMRKLIHSADKYRIEGNFDGEKIWRITLQIVFGRIKFGELLRSRVPFIG